MDESLLVIKEYRDYAVVLKELGCPVGAVLTATKNQSASAKNAEKNLEIMKNKKIMRETDLYAPVRDWLEGLGFRVQGEVCGTDVLGVAPFCAERVLVSGDSFCDSAAVCGENVPVCGERSGAGLAAEYTALAVELKLRLNIELLAQAAERLGYADIVYIAVPESEKKRAYLVRNLCSRLGIGILLVQERGVKEFLAVNRRAAARRNKAKSRILNEFFARKLAVNSGGTNKKKMTAYREEALTIAFYIERTGETSAKILRGLGVDNPRKYLYDNYYGWFVSVSRGVYGLSEAGRSAVAEYSAYREQLDAL